MLHSLVQLACYSLLFLKLRNHTSYFLPHTIHSHASNLPFRYAVIALTLLTTFQLQAFLLLSPISKGKEEEDGKRDRSIAGRKAGRVCLARPLHSADMVASSQESRALLNYTERTERNTMYRPGFSILLQQSLQYVQRLKPPLLFRTLSWHERHVFPGQCS